MRSSPSPSNGCSVAAPAAAGRGGLKAGRSADGSYERETDKRLQSSQQYRGRLEFTGAMWIFRLSPSDSIGLIGSIVRQPHGGLVFR